MVLSEAVSVVTSSMSIAVKMLSWISGHTPRHMQGMANMWEKAVAASPLKIGNSWRTSAVTACETCKPCDFEEVIVMMEAMKGHDAYTRRCNCL